MPSGEKPADAPEKSSDEQGQAPQGQAPQGQAPTGEKPADAPEMPSDKQGQAPTGEKPADAPEMPSGEQGQAPTGQQTPKMIDFDAMVTSGIISQETRDAIKAYMDEHKPEGEMPTAPAEGEAPTAPAEGEALAEGEPNLLNDLLNAGIITQTEYDAMSAA